MQKLAVVYVPNIDLDEINNFRQKYDPNWNIIRLHMTLVFPITNISEKQLIEHIETVTKDVKSFPIRLKDLNKSFDDYLFLLVEEGKEEIVNLNEKLYSGVLASHLQTDVPFMPHITLGYFRTEQDGFNEELYKKAYAEAKEMDINVNCTFDNITLIKGDGLTPAKIIKTLNLN